MTTPSMPYPAALARVPCRTNCSSVGVEYAYRLFSMTKTIGSDRSEARFMASWTSPVLDEPSPKNANPTASRPKPALRVGGTRGPGRTWRPGG
jgi:hypothetical protein